MRRSLCALAALAMVFGSDAAFAGAIIFGPTPGLTGNDTGGIIQYTPDLTRPVYRAIASDWCARWGRLSHITSAHRIYGDYIGFVCIDRPYVIH